jgi:hypothetical protein
VAQIQCISLIEITLVSVACFVGAAFQLISKKNVTYIRTYILYKRLSVHMYVTHAAYSAHNDGTLYIYFPLEAI